MAGPNYLLIGTGIKIPVILLTIAVLALLDPRYLTAYISINYEIVIIYIVASLTLLYCLVSVIMYIVLACKGTTENLSITNVALSEIVLCAAGIIGWLIVCGIGGTVSQRTIIDTGELFGWLAACAGVNIGLFLGILAIFALNLINEKVMSPERKFRGQGSSYYAGQKI